MTGQRWTAIAALFLLAALNSGPALAAPTPSPSPDDRTTSLSVSPTSLSARETLTLKGFSDCAIIDGHLVFDGYDGNPDNVVVRSQQSRYDLRREKYPYEVRIVVPGRARPGKAQVYAEPFCGPPEEYPPSGVQSVRLQPTPLTLAKGTRRPVAGQRLRLTAGTCNGPGTRLTFEVTVAGVVENVRAAVSGDGRASVSYLLPERIGPASVALPAAARECPGSTGPKALTFTVRAPHSATPAVVSRAPESASPSPTPTSSARGVATAPPTADAVLPAAGNRKDGRGPVLALVLAAAGLALGAGIAVWRSRR
ncbi:MAG: hypothetical protein ABIO67_01240 [Mycobacteriales bacterium]